MIDLAGIVVTKLVERAVDEALDELWPREDRTSWALDRLVDGMERQLLEPLHSAISHLELGEFSEAKNCLIKAEGLETQAAPVVKLALAMTLARTGVTGEAVARRVREALSLNPLLAPPGVLPSALDEVPRLRPAGWSFPLDHVGLSRDGR